MPETLKVACAHCWHLESARRFTITGDGYEVQACCQCGARKTSKYEMVPDPKHGPYARVMIKKYTDA